MRFGNAAPSSLAFATGAPFTARHSVWKKSLPRWDNPTRTHDSDTECNVDFKVQCILNIQDCTRYPMGTNEVTKSLHHNENLLDLPFERIRQAISVATLS